MSDPIERALEAASDGVDVDWMALEDQARDGGALDTLRALKELTAIAQAHGSRSEHRHVPFTWGPLEVREHIAHGVHGEVYRPQTRVSIATSR